MTILKNIPQNVGEKVYHCNYLSKNNQKLVTFAFRKDTIKHFSLFVC